jgi:hypothetical protein
MMDPSMPFLLASFLRSVAIFLEAVEFAAASADLSDCLRSLLFPRAMADLSKTSMVWVKSVWEGEVAVGMSGSGRRWGVR